MFLRALQQLKHPLAAPAPLPGWLLQAITAISGNGTDIMRWGDEQIELIRGKAQ